MNSQQALAAIAALTVLTAGCDRISPAPRPAESATPAPAPARLPDLRQYAGLGYAEFIDQPGLERFGPEALGLRPADMTRFERAMAVSARSSLAAGGGAEALVFPGCAETGCDDAAGVVAVDLATGAVFVGVRDGQGMQQLASHPRIEALLRLTSPSGSWDDPIRAAEPPG